MSPRPSSGEQEIPLWYTSNAKASLRTHDSEVEPGQGHLRHHMEHSPPSRAHKRHPRHPRHLRLPHTLFAVDAMWSLPSDMHTADWGNPPQDQNSMWKSKSWESKSPKFRELPRTGEGSPQGLEEHLHSKRKSGWGGPSRAPHPHCHPTLARAGCEASRAKDFPEAPLKQT